MIDFKELSHTDDTWELFARDFLSERGFFIESPPDRGPDGGKDLLLTERLHGNLNSYRFRWLVSCKHFAVSGKAVSEKDEPSILERVSSFGADGFIGFYSTLPSSGLNSRLRALRDEKKLKDYSIFDNRAIENLLVTVGYSHILMRYFPSSYITVKPLHLISNEYEPLLCKVCGKDLLIAMFESEYNANIIQAYKWDKENNINYIKDIYCCCKIRCDSYLESSVRAAQLMSGWEDLSDLIIPANFLRYIWATMNRIRAGLDIYTEEAYKKEKAILSALAQKVLRATTERERERYEELMSLPAF